MTQSPETPRRPSPAEQAMAANAGSRDRQGKGHDNAMRQLRAAHELHVGTMTDPSARLTVEDLRAAFAAPSADHAENEGMAGRRDRRDLADEMPDR